MWNKKLEKKNDHWSFILTHQYIQLIAFVDVFYRNKSQWERSRWWHTNRPIWSERLYLLWSIRHDHPKLKALQIERSGCTSAWESLQWDMDFLDCKWDLDQDLVHIQNTRYQKSPFQSQLFDKKKSRSIYIIVFVKKKLVFYEWLLKLFNIPSANGANPSASNLELSP